MTRALTVCLSVLGLALVGVALVAYFTQTGPDQRVAVIDRDRECVNVPVGETVPVKFLIHNPTRETARVMGVAES